MKKILLDSYAILAYLKQEEGFKKIKAELIKAAENKCPILANEINIGEVCYISLRNKLISDDDLERFIQILLNLPISPIPADFNLILEASKIKACYPISYADCFVVATALKEKAIIITGDPEFKKVQDIVEINWL